jgi:stage V sporulation protein D (sporulation-specific penicillin-binding protein)
MKKLLEGTVSKVSIGTAANAYKDGYDIAGYVGTGKKTTGKYIASFAGFAPAANPKITCIIMLDEPTGESYLAGATAAPVAGNIMKDVLDYMSQN